MIRQALDRDDIEVVDIPSSVIAWYDNEMGYAARLVDLSRRVGDS